MFFSDSREPDSKYSWFVTLMSTIAMIFTAGTPYSFGVFMLAFQDYFSHSSFALSTVFSAELFTFYAGGGIIGIGVARYSIRRTVFVCGLLTVAIAPSLYIFESYIALLLIFSLLGATQGTVFVVLAGTVPQWFEMYRGTATGMMMVGIGLSLLILPPAWQIAFDNLGVPLGFLTIILVTGITFIVSSTICERPPWEEPTSLATGALLKWVGKQLRVRQFQYLLVGVGLAFTWYFFLAAFVVELFSSRGYSVTVASILFGVIGGISVFSRLGSGMIADRLGYRRTMMLSILNAIFGSLFLFVNSSVATILAVFLMGIGLGGIATLYIPIILERFQPEMSTAVVGVFNISLGIFAPVTPPIATSVIAIADSYVYALLLVSASLFGALVCMWLGTANSNLDATTHT